MITEQCWTKIATTRLCLKGLTQPQIDAIEEMLNSGGYCDARAEFAIDKMLACPSREHPYDVLPHILLHGQDWCAPSHDKPKPEPDLDEVRQQQRYEMVNAVRRANVLALVLHLPLVAIPDEWTRQSPEEEAWFAECMAKLEGKPLSQMVRELAERRAMRATSAKPAEPMTLEDTPENRETLRVMVSKLGVDGTRERMRHYANIDIVLAKAQSVTKEVP
jgi:hypothetical protein